MHYKTIILLLISLSLTSCSDDSNSSTECVPSKYDALPLGLHPFYCSRPGELDIDLYNDFTIIKSQEEFNTRVIGWNCIVAFYQRDLIIGKIALQKRVEEVSYELLKDCNKNFHLTVTLTLINHITPEEYVYAAVINKLQPGETVTVETILK